MQPLCLTFTTSKLLSLAISNQKKKIFVVCPVRRPHVEFLKRAFQNVIGFIFSFEDKWEKTQNLIKEYVSKLEAKGYEVYWPARDNPYQNTDKVGIQIITHNRQKMWEADEVHIWYDKGSVGSIFDIGMFFAFVHINGFKKFVIINREDIMPTPHKSFENVILALAKEFDNPVVNSLKERWTKHGK